MWPVMHPKLSTANHHPCSRVPAACILSSAGQARFDIVIRSPRQSLSPSVHAHLPALLQLPATCCTFECDRASIPELKDPKPSPMGFRSRTPYATSPSPLHRTGCRPRRVTPGCRRLRVTWSICDASSTSDMPTITSLVALQNAATSPPLFIHSGESRKSKFSPGRAFSRLCFTMSDVNTSCEHSATCGQTNGVSHIADESMAGTAVRKHTVAPRAFTPRSSNECLPFTRTSLTSLACTQRDAGTMCPP